MNWRRCFVCKEPIKPKDEYAQIKKRIAYESEINGSPLVLDRKAKGWAADLTAHWACLFQTK